MGAISASGIPFVGIGMAESELTARSDRCGFVLNDNEGIERAAAEYFLSLGDFRSYAFVSDTRGQLLGFKLRKTNVYGFELK